MLLRSLLLVGNPGRDPTHAWHGVNNLPVEGALMQ